MKRRLLLLLLAGSAACAHGVSETVATKADASLPGAASPSSSDRTHDPEGKAATPPTLATRSDDQSEPEGLAQAAPPQEQAAAEPPSVQAPLTDVDARERLIRAARKYLGRRFRGDCSAFVRRVFDEAGVVLPELRTARTMTESLYRSMWPVAMPAPGDLAFFRRTRRRDRSAKDPYALTHVAVVEAVDGARVTMIHRTSRGIRRLEMNLDHPYDRNANGILRRQQASERRNLPSLASELFAGYRTALVGKQEPRTAAHGPAAVRSTGIPVPRCSRRHATDRESGAPEPACGIHDA